MEKQIQPCIDRQRTDRETEAILYC